MDSTVRLGEIFLELSTRKNTAPFEEYEGVKISTLQSANWEAIGDTVVTQNEDGRSSGFARFLTT